MEKIAGVGGFLLYLRQEGRGIGLYAKLDAYALQDAGLYTVAAQMLTAPGSTRMAVLSNNPDKASQLERIGMTITERVPAGVHLSSANAGYLATKVRRSSHTIDVPLLGTHAAWSGDDVAARPRSGAG